MNVKSEQIIKDFYSQPDSEKSEIIKVLLQNAYISFSDSNECANTKRNVKIKLIENGRLPKFAHKGDACCDCYARLESPIVIHSKERVKIPLGFALQLDNGYEAIVRPRSGLSSKGIDCSIGTIDFGYTGEVMAVICNNSKEPFTVLDGDRICQLAIRKTEEIEFEQVEELSDTERGANGFGSSGIR